MLVLIGLSAAAWACEGAVFATVAAAVRAGAEPMGPWFSLAAGTLATAIPSAPGHVGTFDWFAAQGLEAYGASAEVAIAFALTIHAVLWVSSTAAGLFYLLTCGIPLRRVRGGVPPVPGSGGGFGPTGPTPSFRGDDDPGGRRGGGPMRAIGMRAMTRRIVDFGRDRKTRLYYAACVVLLVAAAGLRFHDLSEHQLRFDEAAAANYSKGTFSETISNTRYHNSSPILYPLVLYAVQKVESTIFSVRIVPALASVLTIALMLFLLPRLGVARGAAFLAGLLATLSIAAIEHAQDAREYSIDALVALLMVAGLLRYLRDGRTILLCVFLFLAPLLQYGLGVDLKLTLRSLHK